MARRLGILILALMMVSSAFAEESQRVISGSVMMRGFICDNVLISEDGTEIHFASFIPESYDGSEPYALFITLPGWEGLLFQGLGENLRWEDFGITAQEYNEKMIVLAPQLNDWGETSARQAIELTEYFLEHYHIDPARVYLEGYSGGGETGSIVMGLRPDLFTAFLAVSSQWDGDLERLAASQTPVYLVTGEADTYYGADSFLSTYDRIRMLYQQQGLSDAIIDSLIVLDMKPQSWFTERGIQDQHGGGSLIAHDAEIMGWLFSQQE